MEFPARNKEERVDSSTMLQGAVFKATNVFLHTGANVSANGPWQSRMPTERSSG